MKTFFGGVFIEKEKLEEAGIEHPIKLEYYKRINESEHLKENGTRFGVSIVKTEYIPDDTRIETRDIAYLTDDEDRAEEVLDILKRNQVTPIGIEDVICDLHF